MIQPSARLQRFEAQYQREAFRDLTYDEALEWFASLWAEARALRSDLGHDWLADLDADFAVARAVNGLSPDA